MSAIEPKNSIGLRSLTIEKSNRSMRNPSKYVLSLLGEFAGRTK
jgi:hypothetical protein